MAHVYGHCDFFKNNFWFAQHQPQDDRRDGQPRRRASAATWTRSAQDDGRGLHRPRLSLENLIDQHAPLHPAQPATPSGAEDEAKSNERVEGFKVDREYMDGSSTRPSSSRSSARRSRTRRPEAKKFPERAERDVLLFLLEHAPLEHWQRDVLAIIRDEAYYFAPQGQTKIMNEGWASTGTRRS